MPRLALMPGYVRVAHLCVTVALAFAGLVPSASAQTLGQLTPLNCFSTTGVTGCTSQPGLDGAGGLTDNVAVSPDGLSAYAVMSKSTLVQFGIQGDGSLAYVTCIGDATLAGTNPCPVAATGIKQGNGGTGGVVVSPDGAHVYVSGFDSDTVAVFRRDTGGATLGRLTSDGCLANTGVTTCDAVSGTTHGQVPGLDGPLRLAISGDGANVYAPGISSRTVAVLKRDKDGPAAGRLSGGGCLSDVSIATCNGVPGGTSGQAPGLEFPDAVAVSPDGATVYATDALGAVAVLTRDVAGTTPGRLTSDGCLADTGSTKCDGVPGSTKGQAPGIGNPQEPVVSPDGKNVYVGGQSMTAVFKRDGDGATPGRLTSDGCIAQAPSTTCDNVAGSTKGSTPAANASGIAIAPDGANVYTAHSSGSRVGSFRREASGGLTFDGCLANTGNTSCDAVAGATHGQAPGIERPRGLTVAPNGETLYVVSDVPGSAVAFARFVPPPPPPPPPEQPQPPAGGEPPPAGTAVPPAFAGLALTTRTVVIDSKGRGILRVPCPAAAQGPCAGTGVVNSAQRIALRAAGSTPRKRIQRLARFRFSNIQPGTTKRVRFTLTRKAFRLLKRKRSLKSVVSTTAHDSRNADVTKRRRVTLKVRSRRR